MINFREVPGHREFESHALPYLRGAVQRFFGASVKYESEPVDSIKHQYGLDITANARRGVYLVNEGRCAIVLGRILEGREVKAAFALQLTQASFVGMERLLNIFEAALSITVSRNTHRKFADKPHQFGDELLELTISKFFSKGYFDHRSFQVVINLFHDLANSRFEGRNFTTGLVITRSHYAFAEKRGHTREGKIFPLVDSRRLSPVDAVEKRFWYLADGQTSYFIANPSLEVSNLFLADSPRQSLASFVDDYTLSKTIKGGDALFRVTSQSEFSIAGSAGMEFSYKEGRWRVRNLAQIASLIGQALQVEEPFVQGLLYYVFYLSRRRLSSILWVPLDATKVDELLLSSNRLTRQPFSLLEEKHTQTLIRLLSSDGASVFSTDGSLLSFGSIVDISKIRINGVKGTGESVAALLSANGLSVKISQDGTIKLYLGGSAQPLII